MRSLSLASVSFSYNAARAVLSDVDLELGVGWHGLVGANGSGKTTLLRVISGELEPNSGTVMRPDPVIRCDQVVDTPSAEVAAFAASWEPAAYTLRGRMEIEPEMLDRWSTLSPGERRRWQVAAALVADPAVLALDEPTNHLDAESSQLLVAALERFRGIGILVSHDRDLLDQLTTDTIMVADGRVRHWDASYTTARLEWERSLQQARSDLDAATRDARKLARRLADEQRAADLKIAQWKRSQRYARPGDHDTTSAVRTRKFRLGEAAAGKRISAVRDQARRAEDARGRLAVQRDHRGPISFTGSTAPRRVLVECRGPLTAGERVLADHIDVTIERDTRLGIAGRNGAGKTTLLRHLRQRWDLPAEQLLFLPQDLSFAESEEALAGIVVRSADRLGQTMQLFARLGGEPDDVLASDHPSPGELRKLLLADALVRSVWCMMLDEPTNHLDLDTVEALEAAIADYPGALVVVSHDARFTAAVTNTRLEL
ncbi:MAG TPA: ATP-binding cassette domain-containing protein [Acidimicrobiia bacterium]|nr:ATP-binding cassette domain-containing protein [Acidimicrobiia bacterium]